MTSLHWLVLIPGLDCCSVAAVTTGICHSSQYFVLLWREKGFNSLSVAVLFRIVIQ